jgi:PAS domain S-box-containing protein
MILITTNRDDIITTFNSEAGRLLKYEPEELIHKQSISILIKPGSYTLKRKEIKTLVKKSAQFNFEFINALSDQLKDNSQESILLTKAGKEIPVMYSLNKIRENDDNVSGFIFSAIDITQQKELELSLIRAIQTEKDLNEMKSNFVATASHELRTPLATMLLASESLMDRFHTMDPDKMYEKIARIKHQLIQLTHIVENVLKLSKIEAGKIDFDPVNTELITLCNNVIGKFGDSYELTARITLSTPYSEIYMNLDRTLISTALNNLISNAIKYSEKNTGIGINIKQTRDMVSVSVSDQGIGIPANDRKFIFTPFFRASNAGLIQGTGLGLTIVKESVQKHNGTVSFNSTQGKGSTFVISLPGSLINSLT